LDESDCPFGDRWFDLTPQLHRALAGDPRASSPLRQAEAGEERLRVYGALAYTGTVLFGWEDLGNALRRFVTGDYQATSGVHTRLLAWVGGTNHLQGLAGWAWMREVHARGGHLQPKRYEPRRCDFVPHEVLESEGIFGGGFPSGAPGVRPGARSLAAPRGPFRGPVRPLARRPPRGRELHPVGKPPWTVDVVGRHDGLLGSFRRCWTCNRWFIGYAAIHELGHPGPDS